VDASKARALSLIPSKRAAVQASTTQQQVQAAQSEAASVADATVAAAAAGAKGSSVDTGIEQIKSSEDIVQEQLRRQRRGQMLQLDQEEEDIFWEAENNKYKVHTAGGDGSTGRNLAAAALAGVGAYFGS
jgi:hypothetical protein